MIPTAMATLLLLCGLWHGTKGQGRTFIPPILLRGGVQNTVVAFRMVGLLATHVSSQLVVKRIQYREGIS